MEMKTNGIPNKFLFACGTLLISATTFAQNSVTLYGAIDNGFSYQSSQTTLGSTSGGHSATKMMTGAWLGSRFGLKGSEDLGAGNKAIFTLEAGFNTLNGASSVNGLIFNRQSFVGLSNQSYGTLTLGRQYSAYYQLISPFGPTSVLTGHFGAHPGDIDGLDTTFRSNNTVLYTSPTLYGLTISGSYSLGGVAGSFNRGSTLATAIQYTNGPVGAGVGFVRMNNSTLGGGPFGPESTTSNAGAQAGISALNNGYQTAQATQRFAAGASYAFGSVFDVRATYTNVQYIPGLGSLFHDTAIFNTGGLTLHWKPVFDWDFGAGYSYTRATEANGISNSAQYQQIVFSEYYSISKRTGLYAVQGYTHASGSTLGTAGAGHVIQATAAVGDGFNATPSSTPNMFVAGVGLVHRF
jgi:predicted porin